MPIDCPSAGMVHQVSLWFTPKIGHGQSIQGKFDLHVVYPWPIQRFNVNKGP
jgi:hypothetical protein